MKTILYKSGKFYGYEKPEEPKYGRLDKYHAKCDEARANALEIENPELAGVQQHEDGQCYFDTPQATVGPLKDNDTFPLPDTLEWEIVYQLLTMNGWEDTIEANYKLDVEISTWKTARQVLRLKEKAVVKDDTIFIDGDFNDSYESRIRRSKGKERKAVGPSEIHEDSYGIVAIGGIEERGENVREGFIGLFENLEETVSRIMQETTVNPNDGWTENRKADIIAGLRFMYCHLEQRNKKLTFCDKCGEMIVKGVPHVCVPRSENAQSESLDGWVITNLQRIALADDSMCPEACREYREIASDILRKYIPESTLIFGQPSPQEESQEP